MNIEELRDALIDYLGAAMSNGNPMAIIDLERAQSASDEEILCMAQEYGVY